HCILYDIIFALPLPPPPRPPLFPYTTLFRSIGIRQLLHDLPETPLGFRPLLFLEGHPRTAKHQLRQEVIGRQKAFDAMEQQWARSEEHTSELQSRVDLVCRLLLEKKK